MLNKILLFSIFLMIGSTYAQRLFSNSRSFDLYNGYTKWGIQIDGLLYFPAEIDQTNNFSFRSQFGIGYKFGAVYNLNASNHFGFRFGVLAGQVPALNTYFVIDKDEINASDNYQHKKGSSYSPVFNFSIPILFEYRNFLINRYTLSLDAGIQIELTKGTTISESYKNFYSTSVSNPGSWDVDLVVKAGWYFQFKPVMVQTSVVYKYRFINQYTGAYAFTNLKNTPDFSGKFNQKGDYIGLSFDFFFHRQGREVDLGCRGTVHSKLVRKRQERMSKEKEKIRKRQEKLKRKRARKIRKKSKKKSWIFGK